MHNGFWLGLVLLAVHLAVCGGIWLLARTRVLEVEGYFAPVMLLVPLWGPLCVLLLHTSSRLTGGCLREQTLEKLHINEEIHKSILVADDEGEDTVVPLEEALLVDSPAQKRKLILSVLTDDPAGYYDLLQQARMDNDSEVVHYASTALSQITKEADLKLQKLEQRYAAAPDDAAVLEEYCDYLESYLKDGFVQGRAAEIQSHQLEQLLKKRLENLDGRRSCTLECRLAEVQLSLAEYDQNAGRAYGALAPARGTVGAPPAAGSSAARWGGYPKNTGSNRGKGGLPQCKGPRDRAVLAGETAMIKEILSRLRTFRWQKLLIIWAVFVAMAAILFAERSGIQYKAAKFKLNYLPRTEVEPAQTAMFGQPVTCLLLYDSGQDGTDLAKKQFDQILLDMKVSTQAADVHTTSLEGIPEFDRYKTVVVLMSDLDALGSRLIDLMNWVRDGGSVLFAMTPQKTTYFDAISPKLGVLSSSWEYKTAESIVPTEEFMLGGGQRYEFSDPFQSSLSVSLREEATVYARTGDEGVPLVWGTKSGAGRVVVDNIGIYDKIMRGIYAASFSLLCDAAAYPVINSAVFYLDDFPSPVPGGDGSYIRRDYGMSIADFYSKVWWPDLVKLAQQYSIRFTGVMIENYEDDTQSTPVRQPDTQQFRYYGSLLLQQGGEVGFHGYNHQPLVLPDTDYKDLYSYRQWPSEDAIVAAMNELIDFQKTVLPNTEGSVYVPPSNILSAAGRKVLGSKVSQIRTIASTYFSDGTSLPYVQEFGVASDGIVEQPRIVSGGMVGDTYMRLAAMSELNMHYVSTHFMHPDDLLDVDRGAAEGWETYKGGLKDYLKWLSAAAPDLRRQTGTECSAAIQRYAQLTVTLDGTDTAWILHLGNFADEAWLFFRANEGTPGKVTGGELTRLTGDLYLLKANADTVRIEKKGA